MALPVDRTDEGAVPVLRREDSEIQGEYPTLRVLLAEVDDAQAPAPGSAALSLVLPRREEKAGQQERERG